MSRSRIPDREPLGEAFKGALLLVNGKHLLSQQAVQSVPHLRVLAEGDLVVRYGVRFLEKHHRSIVPGLLALDYGDILTGERAWNFIYQRGSRYPRADVIGYTDLGEDEMLPLKVLDIDVPPQVLVYTDADATKPLAPVEAVISAGDVDLPSLMTAHLPRFDSLDAWASAQVADRSGGVNDPENQEGD